MTVLKTKSPGDRLLPRKMVTARYCRGPKTLSRWSEDPDVNFPAPVDIRGQKYYREAELVDWDRRQSAISSTPRVRNIGPGGIFTGGPSAKQHEPA